MVKSVAIIGSGNVATHIAKAIFKAGVEIKYIYSPTLANCVALANLVNAGAVEDIYNIDGDVDLIIISIKDNAIRGIVEKLKAKSIYIYINNTV